MQPRIEILSSELIARILAEAFQLLVNPGIKVPAPRARELLQSGGALVEKSSDVVKIPEATARASGKT